MKFWEHQVLSGTAGVENSESGFGDEDGLCGDGGRADTTGASRVRGLDMEFLTAEIKTLKDPENPTGRGESGLDMRFPFSRSLNEGCCGNRTGTY
jgi:hypothetical protein